MNCLQFPLGSFLKYIFPEANPATSIKTVGSTIQNEKFYLLNYVLLMCTPYSNV